ncbi:MAG: BamA/TamA family outer membrane protein, partial [Thermoanaerobaculia bacterium]
LDVPLLASNLDGTQQFVYEARTDNVPTAGVGFSYDTTRYASFGPQGGKRLDVNMQYTPSFQTGEATLSFDAFLEGRIYLPLSRRVLFAVRGFGGLSRGAAPTVFYFGGLDTLRGYDYRSIIGNSVFYVNTEFRFPLVDVLATPVLQFGGIRGRIFVDVGGAWLNDQSFRFWQDGRLKDGHASYGAGFSIYFLGLPWNVDFSKQWDFRSALSGTQATFYVGTTF